MCAAQKKSDLANLICDKAGDFPKPSCVLLRLASRSIASAPVVIAVTNTGELISRGTELFKVDKNTASDFFRIMEIQSSAAGVLVLIKNNILRFIGEPEGEFMAVVPIGYALRLGASPKKRPLDTVVKYLE